jgi:hypothetical protein
LERPPVSLRPRHTALGRAKGWSGPDLLIGRHKVSFTGPGPDYKDVAAVQIDASGQQVLHNDDKSFVLGSRAGTLPGGDDVISAFAAGPGIRHRLS